MEPEPQDEIGTVVVTDKKGESVTIRLAVEGDQPALENNIADHTGTGSGNGGDAYLIQEFKKNVADPGYTVLFAETTARKTGLGIFALAWSSPTESYWQSLRVSQEARGRGVAGLLFTFAAQLCVKRQGPDSISRWGVVSNNDIMTGWSQRMKLHGPQVFRRHGAKVAVASSEDNAGVSPGMAKDATSHVVELPAGFALRAVTVEDIPAVMVAIKSFAICTSEPCLLSRHHRGQGTRSVFSL